MVDASSPVSSSNLEATDSQRAKDILDKWAEFEPKFVKVKSKAEPVAIPPEEPETNLSENDKAAAEAVAAAAK